jgi:hypothetical protein
VLARSFLEHHPGIPFHVLLADEVDGWFDPGAEPFALIPLSALDVPQLERLRFRYAQQPLSYAATPFLLAHLLGHGVDRVLFFKQESLVLGDHSEAIDRLARHPLVLTPHLLAPLDGPDGPARELNILQSGVFNVGLLGVAGGETTRQFLRWWQDRVSTHCAHAIADGLHYEQRWLDLVPAFFPAAHVLRDPAFNVAHWNLPDRRVEVRGGRVLADGRPCRLFRFSGYDPDAADRPTRYSTRLTWENVGPARFVFERYRRALDAEGYQLTRRWPYAYGAFDNGVPIPDFVRHLYRQEGDGVARFGDPRCTSTRNSYYDWLNEPVAGTSGAVTRLWQAVYDSRSDVRRAFPDIAGADQAGFLAWTVTSGLGEHGIPEALLAPGAPRTDA